MRTAPALVLLALTGCGTAASDPFDAPALISSAPSAPLVRMSDLDAEVLARPCGRRGYDQPLGFAATDAHLAELEADLRVLATAPGAPAGFDPGASVRQVIGFVLADGRQRLYLNAFPAGSACAQNASEPCRACDAGAWGVLYDPQTRTFEDLAFSAGG